MKFAQSHEWIKVEGNNGTVGISYYAQKELGEVVYLELPIIGKVVKVGDEVAILESTKAAADIYSPASGKITAVNQSLSSDVDLLNHFPESEGWLYQIELADLKELNNLMEKEAYLSLVSR